jgi:hypothetical protein
MVPKNRNAQTTDVKTLLVETMGSSKRSPRGGRIAMRGSPVATGGGRVTTGGGLDPD